MSISTEEARINLLTIVTGQGVKHYALGGYVGNEHKIHIIKKEPIHITGDPFDHYVGRSDSGKVLFSVNCLIPCEIEYL